MDPVIYNEPMYPSDEEMIPAFENEPYPAPAYDTDKLIELVKERPVLWNKDEDGKPFPPKSRATAWQEVCCLLYKDYESMSEEYKKQYVTSVKTKWVHTRDAFQKSLKKRRKTGREEPPEGYKESGAKRFEQLKFLKQYYDRKDILSSTLAGGSRPRYVDSDADTVFNVKVKRNLPNKQQQEYRKILLKMNKRRSKLNQQRPNFKPYQNNKIKTHQPAMNKDRVNNVGHRMKREDDDSNRIQYVKDKMNIDNDQDESAALTQPAALPIIKSEDLIIIDEDPLPLCQFQGENDDYNTGILISEDEDESANVDEMNNSISNPKIKEEDETPSTSYNGNAEEIFTPKTEYKKSSDNKCTSLESDSKDDDQRKDWFDYMYRRCKSLSKTQFMDFQSALFPLLKQIEYPVKE